MKTIVVLGMHRSATSLVAGGLSRLIHMGDRLLGPNPSNPQGHYENLRFIKLNDAILKAAGGSWDHPPAEEAILAQQGSFTDRIATLVREEGQGRAIWGWKDPRTTLTARLYLPHLHGPHFICCFRSPEEVALSLHRRDGFDLTFGRQLANEYNSRLLRFLTEWRARQ